MKRVINANLGLMIVAGLFFLAVPLFSLVQFSQAGEDGPPPVGQTLVREGTFAIELAKAFGLPGDADEVEAENWLAEKGISPANGWIADYPVTPDIIGELRKAVDDAAEAELINLDKAEALDRFDMSLAAVGLDLKPLNNDQYARVAEFNNDIVPAAEVVNYYIAEGPPVVTYYAPPPVYYGMYSWISYPFWCGGYWYGGYFILNDFHRPLFIGRNHQHGFVSNHFRDRNHGRFSRIDPQTRAANITATGIGVSGSRTSAPAGSRHNIRSDMNPPRANAPPAIRSTAVNSISNPPRSHAPRVQLPNSFNTTGNQRGFRGAERIITPAGVGNVSHTGGNNSVRSGTRYQSGASAPFRTVTTPVRRTEMPAATITAPRNSSAVTRINTPAPDITPQRNFNRSLSNGFAAGSPSRGRDAGFNAGFNTGRMRR